MDQIYYVIFGAVTIILVVLLILKVRQNMLENKGVLGKRKVAAMLKKYASIRNFKVLDDIDLRFKGNTYHIDHVLIGFFGIMLVNTMPMRGDFYCNEKEKEWAYYRAQGGKKIRLPNPVMQNTENTVALRSLFASDNIYKIPMETAVVFPGSKKKCHIYVTGGNMSAMYLKQFKKYLRHSKFEADKDMDVPMLTEAIMKYAGKTADR
ncbi:nuclease-related domain-containing protein [Candidatus Soleaferrea massiliensis]|uniref:nuclease-related domain-containing protein n=1 Tax=Candidatus Soleaferrea massiliensis TaxID=1470354 RepID=UPI0005913439|nr:nuclease-related domain-containing protein [Candidatus Soleaferrea massiliensis]